MRPTLGVLAALALAACDGGGKGPAGDDDDAPDCGALGVELGYGATAFGVPAADGDPVRFVHGPQGGWHLETAGRVVLPSQEVRVAPALFDGDVQLAGDQIPDPLALVGWTSDGCVGTFSGVRTYIDDPVASLPPGTDLLREFICPLAGRTLRWTVTVESVEGDVVTDEAEVVAVMDAYDEGICAGTE